MVSVSEEEDLRLIYRFLFVAFLVLIVRSVIQFKDYFVTISAIYRVTMVV